MKVSLLLSLAILALLAGCGSGDTKVVVTPDGSTMTQKGDGKTVIETKNDKGESLRMETTTDGTVGTYSDSAGNKIETGGDHSEKLGVAIYPGAKLDDTAPGMSAETPEGTMYSAKYLTGDAIEKVIEFYKKELASRKPKTNEYSTDGDKFAMLTLEEGKKMTAITISKKAADKSTSIDFLVNTKK
jgi:hypothetical protein